MSDLSQSSRESVPVKITIADTIPPEQYDEALAAARTFRDAVLENPQLAVFALTVGRHCLNDMPDSLNDIQENYQGIVTKAAGLLALTDNGRYMEFDADSEDAIAADPNQNDLARTVQIGRGSSAMIADMRRAAGGHSLLLFARRAHAFQQETSELDSIPVAQPESAELQTVTESEPPEQSNKNPAA